jgi:hypothetical protein
MGRSGARSTSTKTATQTSAAMSAPMRLAIVAYLPDVHRSKRREEDDRAKRKELEHSID